MKYQIQVPEYVSHIKQEESEIMERLVTEYSNYLDNIIVRKLYQLLPKRLVDLMLKHGEFRPLKTLNIKISTEELYKEDHFFDCLIVR
jgi:hypothetical protein